MSQPRIALLLASVLASTACGPLVGPAGKTDTDTGWGCGDSDEESILYELDTGETYEALGWEECQALCEAQGESTLGLTDCWWTQYDGEIYAQCWFGDYCEGRPPATLRSDGRTAGPPVGAWLARQAHMEAASVAAFARLAVALECHGAPATLLRRVRRAAADEVRHAAAAGALAMARGALAARPVLEADTDRSLAELAIENAVEGCVNETFAALVAQACAEQVTDAEVAAMMAGIATDEARHAQLAWDLHRWFSSQLDATAWAQVQDALSGALTELEQRCPREVPPSLLDIGVPAAEEQRRWALALAARLVPPQA